MLPSLLRVKCPRVNLGSRGGAVQRQTQDEIALTFLGLAMRHGFRRTAVEDVAKTLRISKKIFGP